VEFVADATAPDGTNLHVAASFDLFQRVHPELGPLCQWDSCWQQGSYFDATVSGEIYEPLVPPSGGLVPFDEWVQVGPVPFDGVVEICGCYSEYAFPAPGGGVIVLPETFARMSCSDASGVPTWTLYIELRWRCAETVHYDEFGGLIVSELKVITFAFTQVQAEEGQCPEDGVWTFVGSTGGGDWSLGAGAVWTWDLDLD